MTETKLTPSQMAHKIADIVIEKKGAEILLLDIEECSDIADYMLIATAGSRRQVQAVADEIRKELKEAGSLPLSMNGLDIGTWALIDYGDVIVHLMQDDARKYYDLEALWADAKIVRRA